MVTLDSEGLPSPESFSFLYDQKKRPVLSSSYWYCHIVTLWEAGSLLIKVLTLYALSHHNLLRKIYLIDCVFCPAAYTALQMTHYEACGLLIVHLTPWYYQETREEEDLFFPFKVISDSEGRTYPVKGKTDIDSQSSGFWMHLPFLVLIKASYGPMVLFLGIGCLCDWSTCIICRLEPGPVLLSQRGSCRSSIAMGLWVVCHLGRLCLCIC